MANVKYPSDLVPWSLHLFLILDGMDIKGQRPKGVFWRPKGVFRRPVRTRPGIFSSCTFFLEKTQIWEKKPFGPRCPRGFTYIPSWIVSVRSVVW